MFEQAEEETQETVTDASAETINPEGHMIPKSRFDEINEANKKLQERIDAIERESKERLETQLQEQGKFKELAEERAKALAEAQSKADKYEATQKVLAQHLEKQIEAIPEDKRSLVPTETSIEYQLEWITKNSALLTKPQAPNIGAGVRGGGADEGKEVTDAMRKGARIFNVDVNKLNKRP